MTKYTPEQKRAHYQKLRLKWAAAKKAIAEDGGATLREIHKLGLSVSPLSFWICLQEMRAAGLEGTPYIDARTFQGWKAQGFKVKKGSRAFGYGISWIDCSKEGDEETKIYPKTYALFHTSQVEAI